MSYDIKKIIDVAIFRELLENFTNLTEMATAILDLNGNIIIASDWIDICAKFHRVNPETSLRCKESDTLLAKELEKNEKYNVYCCKNGLIDIAVPIVVDGIIVGNFFTGQFFFKEPDVEFFRKQAAKYGFEPEPYLEALSRVPVLSEEKVRKALRFLTRMTAVIGELGVARLKLIKSNRQLQRKFDDARSELGRTAFFKFDNIICESSVVKHLVDKAKKIANSPSTILLSGESGTGKEVFAQAIHNASDRGGRPFVPINCGAIPKELIQSELFGYEAGAFTGAGRKGRMGKFEIADGGTLFLDEIGDMPPGMQVNLLRVFGERSIVRIGSAMPIPVDVRLIAATNRDLLDEVAKGNFREDLYYRLSVVTLRLPPLRERPEDVIPIIEYHLSRISRKLGKRINRIHPDAWDPLLAYPWPGNIREVMNAIEQAANMTKSDVIMLNHLPEYLQNQEIKPIPTENHELFKLSVLEKKAIERTLRHHKGNITKVSKALGIGRNTLYDKIKKYGIGQ